MGPIKNLLLMNGFGKYWPNKTWFYRDDLTIIARISRKTKLIHIASSSGNIPPIPKHNYLVKIKEILVNVWLFVFDINICFPWNNICNYITYSNSYTKPLQNCKNFNV